MGWAQEILGCWRWGWNPSQRLSGRLQAVTGDLRRDQPQAETRCWRHSTSREGTWAGMPVQSRNLKAASLVRRGPEGIFLSFTETERQLHGKLSVEKKKSLRNKSPKNVKARNQISDNSDGIRRDQIPNKWKSIITYTMWGTRDCHSESPAPAVVYAHCQISTNHYGDRVTPNCSLGLWVWEWVLGLATWNKRVKYEKGHFKTPFQKVARLQRCLCG